MRALTIRQPWASLIAHGFKTIETRSWSTKYRGPLAIHAGATRPPFHPVGLWWPETRACGGMRLDGPNGQQVDLPLGAVVATCTLADVLPIYETTPSHPEPDKHQLPCVINPHDGGNQVTIVRWNDEWDAAQVSHRSERPYGDFTTGRWAWILEDVVPVVPVPAKGRQGLWTWEPT